MTQPFWRRTFRYALSLLAGQHFGGNRDLYEIFGYPRALSVGEFFDVYSRGDIAARIVDAYPDATWREAPVVKPKDAQPDTPWQLEFEKFAEQFQLWSVLTRLDRLTGIGHYGVLMFGLDGGQSTTQPVTGKHKLLYLTPHSEFSASITKWISEPRDPRYGTPETYLLASGVEWTGSGGGVKSINVHHSRTLHVAERAMSDRSLGVPRLERVFNRLMDLDKLLGGSAEIYWQNAGGMRAWKADSDVEWTEPEKAAMAAELEEAQHGLRRDVRVRGVEPQMLAAPTQGTDASQNIDKQLDMIAGATGIPKRILVGSERGELSSEQDENNWAARVAERRTVFAGPMIITPFVSRMIELGVLAEPPGGEFEVIWSESDALGEEKRATIAKTKAEAVAAYANSPGASLVIPTEEFRRWLGEDEESEFMPEQLDVVDGPPGSAPLPEEDDQVVVQFDQHRQARRGDPPATNGDGAPASPIVNATPRPLYVRRQVKNWRALERWAKEQGLKSTLGEAMHVTIAYSRSPVDWIKAGQAFDSDAAGEMSVAPGGPRVVEALGPNGAVVLHFASSSLAWRHEDIKRAGASWDYATYQPHVTLTYDVGELNVEELEPYRGGIELGPEIFEELDDNFAEHIIEYSVNAQRQAEERRTNTLRELATTVATSVSEAVRETIVPLIRERDRPRRIKKTAVRNAAGFIDHVIEEESDE